MVPVDVAKSYAIRFDELADKFKTLNASREESNLSPQSELQLAMDGGEMISGAWSHGLLMAIKERYDKLDETILVSPTSSMIFYRVFGYCCPFFHHGGPDDGRFAIPYYELDVGCIIDWKTFALGKPICSYDFPEAMKPQDDMDKALFGEESDEVRFVLLAKDKVISRYVTCCFLLASLIRDEAMRPSSESKQTGDTKPYSELFDPRTRKATESKNIRVSKQPLLEASFSLHHLYENDGIIKNMDPIGCNELSKKAGVAKSVASEFFNHWFGGHKKYSQDIAKGGTKLRKNLDQMNDVVMSRTYGTDPDNFDPD